MCVKKALFFTKYIIVRNVKIQLFNTNSEISIKPTPSGTFPNDRLIEVCVFVNDIQQQPKLEI